MYLFLGLFSPSRTLATIIIDIVVVLTLAIVAVLILVLIGIAETLHLRHLRRRLISKRCEDCLQIWYPSNWRGAICGLDLTGLGHARKRCLEIELRLLLLRHLHLHLGRLLLTLTLVLVLVLIGELSENSLQTCRRWCRSYWLRWWSLFLAVDYSEKSGYVRCWWLLRLCLSGRSLLYFRQPCLAICQSRPYSSIDRTMLTVNHSSIGVPKVSSIR